jgi:hypothetical protein
MTHFPGMSLTFFGLERRRVKLKEEKKTNQEAYAVRYQTGERTGS